MLNSFDYLCPKNTQEAIQMLLDNQGTEILAGGTDLLLELREKFTPDKVLIDIKKCADLQGIEEQDDFLSIGALTTIREIQLSKIIKEEYKALLDAADVFGCLEIRNRATIGGNIVHASPGAEYGTPLFGFEAEVEITGPNGSRIVPIDKFWFDLGRVELKKAEILKSILLPKSASPVLSGYLRLSRVKGMDLASLGVSVVVINPGQADKREIRVAMAAVQRTPYRNSEIEELLSHKEIDINLIEEAKAGLAASIAPRESSLRAKPAYKKAMVGTLMEKILKSLKVL
jgi:CO/xanthine dehydrogenase FAD-binding subunit